MFDNHLMAGLQPIRDGRAMLAKCVNRVFARFEQAIGDALIAGRKFLQEFLAGIADLIVNAIDARYQLVCALARRLGNPPGDFVANRAERDLQALALGANAVGGAGGGALGGLCDFFGRGANGAGDALARAGDALGQALADRFELGGDAFMRFDN